MTVIKLKNDLEVPDCCDQCPFIEYVDEIEYGEFVGWATAYCGIDDNKSIIGDTRDPDCGLYGKQKTVQSSALKAESSNTGLLFFLFKSKIFPSGIFGKNVRLIILPLYRNCRFGLERRIKMLYLVEVFDNKTKEFIPVGIFDNTEKVKRIFDGYKYSIIEYKLNVPDYNTINQI